jgi:purine-cytosine permease-like protein
MRRVDSVELGVVEPARQTQRPLDLFLIFAGANIVATTLQMGAYLPPLAFGPSLAMIAAGALAGGALVGVLAPVGSALGVPSIVATRAVLGHYGAQGVALLLFATNFVWIAVNNAIAASITARVVNGPSAGHQPAWAVVFGLIATAIVLGGPRLVGLANRAAVPLLLAAGVAITLACVAHGRPAAPADAAPLSWQSGLAAFEVVFGYQTTWLLMFADYSRYTRRGAAPAVSAGLGLTALWFIPLGLVAARAAGSADPGAMIFALGLGWWGAVLVILGTLTTNFVNIYMSALAMKSLWPSVSGRGAVLTIGGVGAALSVLSAELLARLGDFTVALSGLFVPIGGVLVAHFLLLRRHDSPASLYAAPPARLPAVGRWSVPGVTAWSAGAIAFYAAGQLGSVLPGFGVSILVYLLLMRRR